MASLTDTKQQELVFAFKTICLCEDRTAQWYLLAEGWSLQRATDRYYNDGCRPKTARDLNELIKQRMKADERAQQKAHELVVLFQPAPFGAHLQANMAQLLESETLSDVVLVLPSSQRIPAHRLVLSSASPVLAAALQRRSSESEKSGLKQELVLDDEQDEAAFRAVLAYVYTGRIAIAPKRVLNVLAAAHRYGVEGLKERCGIHLFQLSRVDRHKHDERHEEEDKGKERSDGESEADEIARLLGVAHEYRCRELERLCAEQLASRFPVLHASGQLNVLPLSTFVELIKSDKAMAYEEDVLAAVIAYVDHNQQQRPLDDDDNVGESADDLLSRLLLYVRFPFLPSACLVTDVERNQRLVRLPVVRDLLFEAYRYSFFRRFGQDTGPKEKQQDGTTFSTTTMTEGSTTTQQSSGEESDLDSSPPHRALRVTPRTGVLRWNAAKKGAELKLTQNELSAMHQGPSSVWSSVVSTMPFSADLTSAYVHVDRNASRFIVIGIVKEGWPHNGTASQRLGDDENGWGFCSQPNSAKVHAGSASGTYGTPFVTGDVIGVHLDQKKGELAFSCNGHHYGSAFVGLQTETRRYYLAVSLYHAHDQVTLRLLAGKPASDRTTDGDDDNNNNAEQNHFPANDDDFDGFGLFE